MENTRSNDYCQGWWDAMDACRTKGVPTALNKSLQQIQPLDEEKLYDLINELEKNNVFEINMTRPDKEELVEAICYTFGQEDRKKKINSVDFIMDVFLFTVYVFTIMALICMFIYR